MINSNRMYILHLYKIVMVTLLLNLPLLPHFLSVVISPVFLLYTKSSATCPSGQYYISILWSNMLVKSPSQPIVDHIYESLFFTSLVMVHIFKFFFSGWH